jgi:hypothetical protein
VLDRKGQSLDSLSRSVLGCRHGRATGELMCSRTMANYYVPEIKPQTGVLHRAEMYDGILRLIRLNEALSGFWPRSVPCRQKASKHLKTWDPMLKEQAVVSCPVHFCCAYLPIGCRPVPMANAIARRWDTSTVLLVREHGARRSSGSGMPKRHHLFHPCPQASVPTSSSLKPGALFAREFNGTMHRGRSPRKASLGREIRTAVGLRLLA